MLIPMQDHTAVMEHMLATTPSLCPSFDLSNFLSHHPFLQWLLLSRHNNGCRDIMTLVYD